MSLMREKYLMMITKKLAIEVEHDDFVNLSTGEVKKLTTTIHDPEEYRQIIIPKKGIPKKYKAKSRFLMLTMYLKRDKRLNHEEVGIFIDLSDYVSWEDNNVRANGINLNLTQISQLIGVHRKKLKNILDKFENLGLIIYKGNAREKTIELSKDYVWFGTEKSRNIK